MKYFRGMKFHFYAHSTFAVSANDKTILFDPFLSGNPKLQGFDITTVQCDYILISHAHADHITDCIALAKQTGAQVICAWEIHEWLNKNGVEYTHPMNTGGSWDFIDFKVKCVVAQHSSGLPDGSYGGNPMGFIVWFGEQCFYYAGDTALTIDMSLIPTWAQLDFAVLPIGDNFTMDAKDAARAAQMVQTKKVIGIHYDTFGFIEIDEHKAKQEFSVHGIECILPAINTSFEI